LLPSKADGVGFVSACPGNQPTGRGWLLTPLAPLFCTSVSGNSNGFNQPLKILIVNRVPATLAGGVGSKGREQSLRLAN